MKAIIPVAGKGIRLIPHTYTRQKALLPVGGKPLLDHIVEPLIAAGISDIALVIGHLGEQVRQHAARYDRVAVVFREQAEQLGLGHAVFLGLDLVNEPAIIVLSDTIFEMDLSSFTEASSNLIGVVEVPDPQRFGVVETVGRRVVDMVEKPESPVSNLAIAGIYRIESQRRLKAALKTLFDEQRKTKGEYQLTDGLRILLNQGEAFRTVEVEGWLDCGTLEAFLATNRHLLQPNGGVFVHPDATAEGSTIRSSAIMENCHVIDSIIDNSIVLPGARLEKCYIHDEIVKAGIELVEYHSGQA